MNQKVAGTIVIGGMLLAYLAPEFLALILIVVAGVLTAQHAMERSQR